MSAIEGLLATIGAKGRSVMNEAMNLPNPGRVVASGVDRITDPSYPVDAALRRWVSNVPAFQPTLGGMLQKTGTKLLDTGTEFVTALQNGDYESAINSPIFPMGAMTAYHGSPHKFDAFDLSKIGTGEGAQAYGHGLYFAENKGVAKGYSTAGLLGTKGVRVGGRVVTSNGTTGNSATAEDYAVDALTRFKGDKKAAIEWLDDFGSGAEARKWIQANIKGKTAELADVGNLYHVDIPDDEIAKMLDWDKPLSEQPESVRKAISSNLRVVEEVGAPGEVWHTVYLGDQALNSSQNREKLLGRLEESPAQFLVEGVSGLNRQGKAAFNQQLVGFGIPGIKYLDGGSRFTSGAELIGVWRGDQKVMADKASGEWFARVGKKSIDVNGPVTGMVTSPPMKSAEAAKEWADSKIAGGSRNFVLFDDKLAKVLKRE